MIDELKEKMTEATLKAIKERGVENITDQEWESIFKRREVLRRTLSLFEKLCDARSFKGVKLTPKGENE